MEKLAAAFAVTLGKYVSKEAVVFIISMIPILELRGGLIVSKLLEVPITTAIPLCIIGNIIPIPFILLFIKQIFKWMKKIRLFRGLVEKLENKAMSKSDNIKRYEFWGLVLFVGIPLPGTGAWTGSLIAALLDVDFKRRFWRSFLVSRSRQSSCRSFPTDSSGCFCRNRNVSWQSFRMVLWRPCGKGHIPKW